MSILKFLGWDGAVEDGPSPRIETIRKIVKELENFPPERARYLAAFAALLSRVARADMDVSEDETRAMERIVVEQGGIPEEQAVLVVQIAKTQSLLFGGTEHYLVSKEFDRMSSRAQKLALLRCLFEVSAADDSISTAEDSVVRQVADELGLEHGDFVAVRGEFRDRLAVLRKPAPGGPEGSPADGGGSA